ncbi:MAG: protease complex subunit PrcB family protein [Bacteroidota bacterium]
MQRFLLLISLSICLGLFACKSSKNPSSTAEPLSFEILDEGPYCGIEETTNRLITSQDQWLAFYKRFGSNRMPAPEAPAVNFEEQYVIACVMGMRTSGGYRIELSEMQLEGETAKVKLTYLSPGPRCSVTEALTQPYLFALINKQSVSSTEFEVVERTENCNQ